MLFPMFSPKLICLNSPEKQGEKSSLPPENPGMASSLESEVGDGIPSGSVEGKTGPIPRAASRADDEVRRGGHRF